MNPLPLTDQARHALLCLDQGRYEDARNLLENVIPKVEQMEREEEKRDEALVLA